MTSIVNMFSNSIDLIKKSVTDNVTMNKNNTNREDSNNISCHEKSPSLNQGEQFKKYQGKIITNLENRIEKTDLKENDLEGFQSTLTQQTNDLIHKNDFSTHQQMLQKLRNDYENTLQEYNAALENINKTTTDYVDRVNSNNPYLDKVIQFNDGNSCYVTKKGIAKWIPNIDLFNLKILKKENIQKQTVQINLPWSNNYKNPGASIPSQPPLITGTPIVLGQGLGNEGSNVFVNSLVKNPTSVYKGCYNNLQQSNPNSYPAMTNAGQMNYGQCMNYAMISGNKYYGFQSVNTNGLGNCMVSNSFGNSVRYGEAKNYTSIPLWSSGTTGDKQGASVIFENGSLSVLNSSGAAVFSTPNNTTQPTNYIGCYRDQPNRAMNAYNNGSQSYNNSTCQQAAASIGAQYYGLQDSRNGQNAQCFTSNNLSNSKKYGIANNCTQISDGSWSGGGWSNAVYNTSAPTTSYFLILHNNGNLCIYKGNSPSDNQGKIWCSQTNGKKNQPNPNFAAANGKYGTNFVASGATLAPGDFIGSNDGSTYLIMQTDGNLVLYTSTTSSKCIASPNTDNQVIGAQDANAIYMINQIGNKNSIGKLAYIDDNSALHSYPNNNIKYSNSYTSYVGLDSPGNDIPDAAHGNSSLAECTTSCNSMNDCAGFTISNDVCSPKTSSMYPNGSVQVNSNVNLYTRNKSPITPPVGVSGTVINIDSIAYDNYKNGGPIRATYGLSNATTVEKQQIEKIQKKLHSLTSQMNKYTDKFESGHNSLNIQSDKNIRGLRNYLMDYTNINNNIKNTDSSNIENILKDSDITVLQKNYDYLFWSILATGTVLVTMNIVKK